MAEKKDLYKILNIKKNATEAEIRQAYKSLARKYHPDMHASKPDKEKAEMQERFKEINNAHEILTNKDKRAFYDATGMTEEEAGQQYRSGGKGAGKFNFGGFPGGGFEFGNFTTMGGDGFHEFMDIGSVFGEGGFEGMFGSGRRREAKPTGQKAPNAVVEYKLAVTLEEICNGAVRQIRIRRHTPTGAREEVVKEVNILPGYKYGTKITYANTGDFYSDGRGTDIVVVLTEKKHSLYRIEGNDIVYEFDVGVKEYLKGFSKTIKGLKGNAIVIDSRLVGDNSREAVIEGEGVPDRKNGMKRGRLIVKPRIIMDLTAAEKKLVGGALML